MEYFYHGVWKADKGDLRGAIADYTQAIQLNPNDATAYQNRGAVRAARGDLRGATEDTTKASEIRALPQHAGDARF
jgi:Flp pilus assembly protein TadD